MTASLSHLHLHWASCSLHLLISVFELEAHSFTSCVEEMLRGSALIVGLDVRFLKTVYITFFAAKDERGRPVTLLIGTEQNNESSRTTVLVASYCRSCPA